MSTAAAMGAFSRAVLSGDRPRANCAWRALRQSATPWSYYRGRGLQVRILRSLARDGPATRYELFAALHGHVPKRRIDTAARMLMRAGLVTRTHTGVYVLVPDPHSVPAVRLLS